MAFLGPYFIYMPLDRATSFETMISVSMSFLPSIVLLGPTKKLSSSMTFSPSWETTFTSASMARNIVDISAAGEALHRLPPIVALFLTCTEPRQLAAWHNTGIFACMAFDTSTSLMVMRDPNLNPLSYLKTFRLGMPFKSMMHFGSNNLFFIPTSRSVPPDSRKASSCSLKAEIASAKLEGFM